MVAGAMGLGGVLDDVEPVLGGEREQRREVGRPAVEVDRQDGARARRDLAPRVRGVDPPGPGIGVHQDRSRARVAHRVGGGDEGEVRHQDLVPRPEPEDG